MDFSGAVEGTLGDCHLNLAGGDEHLETSIDNVTKVFDATVHYIPHPTDHQVWETCPEDYTLATIDSATDIVVCTLETPATDTPTPGDFGTTGTASWGECNDPFVPAPDVFVSEIAPQ
jgi:hypothetical protein